MIRLLYKQFLQIIKYALNFNNYYNEYFIAAIQMLKRPGAFSLNYMSNPLPNKQSRIFRNTHKDARDKNKQNNNINGTFQDNDTSVPANCEDTKSFEKRNPSVKNVYKTQTKLKMEWEKQEKQLKQQINKLKKQNQKLRDDAKRAHKNNQENICSYQNYIKEVEAERDFVQRQCLMYKQQLKFCILWIIQTFSLGRNPSKQQQLLQNKLSKTKMMQVFQKLAPTIEQLQLQKHLKQAAVSEGHKQEYLIFQKSGPIQKFKINDSVDDFNNLLDTFDLCKQTSTKSTDQQAENIARRLFVNDDTFGHQIGDHSISHDHHAEENQNQNAFVGSVSTQQRQSGTTVKIKQSFMSNSEDYLQVKRGDQVKLLRKVGDLWIAQSGSKIGYISQKVFN